MGSAQTNCSSNCTHEQSRRRPFGIGLWQPNVVLIQHVVLQKGLDFHIPLVLRGFRAIYIAYLQGYQSK
jgi:hypothetical protein